VELWITLLEDLTMAVEQSSTSVQERQDLSQIIRIDEAKVGNHLNGLVRETVQETLNKMLDAEAQEMCNAQRHERTEARKDCRAGFYQHKLQTQAGEVELNVPKLRHAKFETAIIERYRRRESSIEEALMEMYLAGVSVRRVEDITEALWGMRVSAGTGSDLNQKLYERIEQWRNQPIPGGYPYLYLDGICLKRSWAGEVRNVSVLVAVGIGTDGFREILGVAEGPSAYPRGERLPGRPLGADAGGGSAALRLRQPLGHPVMHGHGPPQRNGGDGIANGRYKNRLTHGSGSGVPLRRIHKKAKDP
jgi:hypothetical protein